jgi:hypothetical protein
MKALPAMVANCRTIRNAKNTLFLWSKSNCLIPVAYRIGANMAVFVQNQWQALIKYVIA